MGFQTFFEAVVLPALSWMFPGVRIPPDPGTHEAALEEDRVGGMLNRAVSKPPGQRDEELVHALSVEYRRWQLANRTARAAEYAAVVAMFERPSAYECCAATAWVSQRVAACYRALHDYCCQQIQQIREEMAALDARRPAVIVVQPAFHLNLPEALQQHPRRLDLCSVCAKAIQEVELAEESCRVHSEFLRKRFLERGLQSAHSASAVSQGAAGAAAAAADLPAGEAQQGQQQQQQQQHHHHQQQVQQRNGHGFEGAPATPKQSPAPLQQPQRTSSEQEREREQHACSCHE